MRFVTIGYGDEDGYNRTDQGVRDDAHAHDAQLLTAGAVIGIAGEPVVVRNTEAKGVHVSTGSFMTAPLPIAGFAIIEAASLEDAIALVSLTPCAVAYGVVEVWPLRESD